MKFLINELFKYIDSKVLSENKLINLFMSLGYEVEDIISLKNIKGVELGEVIEQKKHPNADNLSLCKIKTKNIIYDVVCGGKNIAKGQIVAHALPDSIVNGIRLKPKEIRGIISQGMVLSISEIGGFSNLLVENKNKDNIFVFKNLINLNDKIENILNLNTYIYDLTILPDRTYALNYLKMAKEMSAFLGVSFLEPKPHYEPNLNGVAEINKKYKTSFGVLIEQIKTKTPVDIKMFLYFNEIKVEDNINDILNYVNLLTGSKIEIKGKSLISSSDEKIKESSPDYAHLALMIAISLGLKYEYITKVGKISGTNTKNSNSIIVNVTSNELEKYVGENIDYKKIVPILERLGFIFSDDNERIKIPLYRTDVISSQDMIEEIVRAYNIKNIIPQKPPITKALYLNIEIHKKIQREIIHKLIKYGFFEIKTYQLLSENNVIRFNLNKIKKFIKLSKEYNFQYDTMQSSLLYGLLKTHVFNYRKAKQDIRLFELSNVFYEEKPIYTLGLIHDTFINPKEPILATKELLLKIISAMGLDNSLISYKKTSSDLFNPYNVAKIFYNKKEIGIIGELHPKLLREFKYIRVDKIKEKLFYLEIKLETLLN